MSLFFVCFVCLLLLCFGCRTASSFVFASLCLKLSIKLFIVSYVYHYPLSVPLKVKRSYMKTLAIRINKLYLHANRRNNSVIKVNLSGSDKSQSGNVRRQQFHFSLNSNFLISLNQISINMQSIISLLVFLKLAQYKF